MIEIYEKLKIAEFKYPNTESLNPLLHDVIIEKNMNDNKPPAVHAKMSDWRTEDKMFDIVKEFAEYNLVREFDVEGIKCSECWSILYDNGDYVESHNHEPSMYSFVYFVNTPENSSPLIFDTSGFKVQPEEGKMVIFDSKLNHHVPINYCAGRSIVSGNFCNATGSGVYNLVD